MPSCASRDRRYRFRKSRLFDGAECRKPPTRCSVSGQHLHHICNLSGHFVGICPWLLLDTASAGSSACPPSRNSYLMSVSYPFPPIPPSPPLKGGDLYYSSYFSCLKEDKTKDSRVLGVIRKKVLYRSSTLSQLKCLTTNSRALSAFSGL